MDYLHFVRVWNSYTIPPGQMFIQCIFGSLFGLMVLYGLSVSGRPVAHRDRYLASKHKKAEAKRVQILEGLKRGSRLADGGLLERDLDDAVVPGAGRLSDVEEPLLRKSDDLSAAKVATVSLSAFGGCQLDRTAYELMKGISREAAMGESDTDDSFVCTWDRSLMQSHVELHDGLFGRLDGMLELPYFKKHVESLKSQKDTKPSSLSPSKYGAPLVQVDSWAVLKVSAEGVLDLLRLPGDKVPVILHTEYAAGLLTITGLNLEFADIYISGEDAYKTVKLKVWRFEKGEPKGNSWKSKRPRWGRFSETEEDVASLPLRLPWRDMNTAFVYATKKVQLGANGEYIDAVSKAVRVVDSFWATVLGLWIPTICVWIFTVSHLRGFFTNPYFPWETVVAFQPFWIFYVMMLLNPGNRKVEFVKFHCETVAGGFGRGILVFYYGLKGLRGPTIDFPKGEKPKPPPLSLAPKLAPPSMMPRPPPGPLAPRRPAPPRPGTDDQADCGKPVEDPDWEWPAYDEYEDSIGNTRVVTRVDKHSEGTKDVVSPFRVIYRRKADTLWPDAVRVDLFSTPLIKIIQQFVPQNGDLRCLEAPPIQVRDLFVVLDGLKSHAQVPLSDVNVSLEGSADEAGSTEAAKDAAKGQLHLQHLLRFMENEFSDVTVRQKRMAKEKQVAWDMIWTFLAPGRKVVYTCDHSQEVLAAVVSKISYTKVDKQLWVLLIDLNVWDYDGRSYRQCEIRRTIDKYVGVRAFSSLAVCPIEMGEVAPESLYTGFLAKGKRFQELAMKSSHRFMHYSGPIFRIHKSDKYGRGGGLDIAKDPADGRVMIDLTSFAKMKPWYPMRNAKPPVASYGATSEKRPCYSDEYGGESRSVKFGSVANGLEEVCDGNLVFAPAIVYGFSFSLKKWGSFAVSGFSDISFDTNAFSSLVMEPEPKQLVFDLVRQYIATPAAGPSEDVQRIDPIPENGEGCIFLCYGPPGTGKTLTAESVAENMHRPLWSLSIAELGAASGELEQTLVKILDISATWRAVLLIDEADVLLEKQSSSQVLLRNSITSILLRFLENYRGVMFLTTNRIGTFDDAIRSRISMFLHYPKLSVEHKAQVWMTLLHRAGVAGITSDFISDMAEENLNGREIRNTIHTAQILAKSKGEALHQSHVLYSTKVLLSSLKTLGDNTTS